MHAAVAAQVFNVPPEHVEGEMRRRVKVINFGILYGMGVNALRQNLGTIGVPRFVKPCEPAKLCPNFILT